MSEPVCIEKSAYTYADYLEWNDGKRYELIDGTAYMVAAPPPNRQRISLKLSRLFGDFLEGKSCEVFTAPFDVRLFPQKNLSDDTVVQPDLLVVCDKTKLDQRGCNGAPDLVIEILSPSNNGSEMFHKFQKYLEARVREYWIINPETQVVQAHILENDHYISTVYQNDDVIPVSILSGFSIDLKTIWSALQ